MEGQNWDTRAPENAKNNPLFKEQTRAPYKKVAGYKVATLTDKLGAGWSLAFLPGGKLLISEKLPGALRILDAQGNLSVAARRS